MLPRPTPRDDAERARLASACVSSGRTDPASGAAAAGALDAGGHVIDLLIAGEPRIEPKWIEP